MSCFNLFRGGAAGLLLTRTRDQLEHGRFSVCSRHRKGFCGTRWSMWRTPVVEERVRQEDDFEYLSTSRSRLIRFHNLLMQPPLSRELHVPVGPSCHGKAKSGYLFPSSMYELLPTDWECSLKVQGPTPGRRGPRRRGARSSVSLRATIARLTYSCIALIICGVRIPCIAPSGKADVAARCLARFEMRSCALGPSTPDVIAARATNSRGSALAADCVWYFSVSVYRESVER